MLGLAAMYIGATVVTRSSEMIRGFVSITRSRPNEFVFADTAVVTMPPRPK